MAELILTLEIDPVTGKKNLRIDYGSDADALPMEHEAAHQALVDALIEGGALSAAELGQIVIGRGEARGETEVPAPEDALAEPIEVERFHSLPGRT